jgi:four helix bundle protein
MDNSVIYTLSKRFALRIVKLYQILLDRKEFVMSKQLYRSGTSIGANLAESLFAQSDADYISKLKIALKEASETKYWIELLYESDYLEEKEYISLNNDVKTIIGTLVNIVNKLNKI